MSKKVKRKTFAAREDLLSRLGEIAEFWGDSLYNFVNQIFILAIRADELKVNMGEILDEHTILDGAKDSGFILVHEGLWREVIDEVYRRDEEWALRKWFEAGRWLAKKYSSRGLEDPLEAFKANLKSFTWNASEFSIRSDEKSVSVRLISPRFSESQATLFSSLLEGALEVFGYTVVTKDVSTGSIRLRGEDKRVE